MLACICGLSLCSGSALAQSRSSDQLIPAQTGSDDPCSGIAMGNISFNTGSYTISPALENSLNALAGQMQYSPACRVVILGSGGGSKVAQQLSWSRVNAVIEYMSDQKNIDRNRFVFVYGSDEASANTVLFRTARGAEVNGPSNVAAPHPDLQR